MAAHDDMLHLYNRLDCTGFHSDKMTYLQVRNGMLHDSFAGHIAVNQHVPQVPVHDHLLGKEVENGGFLEVAIGATNPENLLRRLLQAWN